MIKSNFLEMEFIKSRLIDSNVSDYIIYLEQSIDNINQKLNKKQMGKYKRNKTRIKKVKRFVTIKQVIDFINSNIDKLNTYPTTTIQIEKREVHFGDEYGGEDGYEYVIFFEDKTAYIIGKTIVHDDNECWSEEHCLDYYQERWNVNPLEILEKIKVLLKN